MERHVLSAPDRDRPGELPRSAGLFSRRGYNSRSLMAGKTANLGVGAIAAPSPVDSLITLFKLNCIREAARTGLSALERGPVALPLILSLI